LEEAAESFASQMESQLGLERSQFGVNIWLVRGMKGFKRLVREAAVAESHSETPIRRRPRDSGRRSAGARPPFESIEHAYPELVAFGGTVEVISPSELRERIAATGKELVEVYGEV
jgi:predicted DNA-binding transcriptional regulator YafY